MRPIDADALYEHKVSGVIGNLSGDFVPGFVIDGTPTLDCATDKHGEWIHDINNLYGCSECLGRETMSHKALKRFCPNCGAKMDGGEVE